VVDFREKLYLAPLTTVGNLPFRRVCKRLGADVTCGEMALATNLLQGQASEWALVKRHPSEDLFGIQVCGGYPDTLSRLCEVVEAEGLEVDFVDINMGCPLDLVCNKGAGSCLLRKPQKMEQIVRASSAVLSCPLTIKTRTGFNMGDLMAHTLLRQARGWGAAAATLHGRSRAQRYSKSADWDYIKRCAREAPDLPLIGNGDVFSYAEYQNAMWRPDGEPTGLATTMVARGALIKPWVFTEVKERRVWDISASERLDHLRDFVSHGLEHWGSDQRGVESTRRFLLEWLSFTCRYVPVGVLEQGYAQHMQHRVTPFVGRNDLETLLGSLDSDDWIKISTMLLGPPPEGFQFRPRHKANASGSSEQGMALDGQANG